MHEARRVRREGRGEEDRWQVIFTTWRLSHSPHTQSETATVMRTHWYPAVIWQAALKAPAIPQSSWLQYWCYCDLTLIALWAGEVIQLSCLRRRKSIFSIKTVVSQDRSDTACWVTWTVLGAHQAATLCSWQTTCELFDCSRGWRRDIFLLKKQQEILSAAVHSLLLRDILKMSIPR